MPTTCDISKQHIASQVFSIITFNRSHTHVELYFHEQTNKILDRSSYKIQFCFAPIANENHFNVVTPTDIFLGFCSLTQR